MDNAEKKRFVTLLTGIADYYGKPLSTGVIGLYWQGLRQYDLEAVEKALWAHTQNPDSGQWMPKIADVTKMLEGRTADQAAIAWSKVDGAIIHRVLADMGGWLQLMAKTEADWPFIAREFENRYRGYRMRGEAPEYPPVLVGIANAHNGKEGMRKAAPVLIGDQRLAERVHALGSDGALIEMRQAGALAAPAAVLRIGSSGTDARAA